MAIDAYARVLARRAAQKYGDCSPEKWELINYAEISGDGEADGFEFTTDSDGNSFSLKKARLLVYLPKYTGESSPPSYSFSKINGIFSGDNAPLVYTGFVTPSASNARAMFWEAGINERGLWYEKLGETKDSANENAIGYNGAANSSCDYEHPTGTKTDALYPITSIGTQNNLIFPGCKFWLYGVNA